MLPGLRLGHVRRSLLSLAAGGFAIGTSEFLMLGLLPQVADDLDVSIPTAGQLIAAYALGVVVGAPLLTAASVRFGRKNVLLVLMTAYAVGNIVTAMAPTFLLVLLARFATGLPHGAFFGVGSVVATRIAPPDRRTLAMSIMFAGLTMANVVGVARFDAARPEHQLACRLRRHRRARPDRGRADGAGRAAHRPRLRRGRHCARSCVPSPTRASGWCSRWPRSGAPDCSPRSATSRRC